MGFFLNAQVNDANPLLVGRVNAAWAKMVRKPPSINVVRAIC